LAHSITTIRLPFLKINRLTPIHMTLHTAGHVYIMRRLLIFLALFHSVLPTMAGAKETFFTVRVVEPFIELHTGPGRGYPVVYVVDRGTELSVIKRRTDWFLVRTRSSREGWVSRGQIEQTLTSAGAPTHIDEPGIGDFSERRWETALLGGRFDGADLATVYGAYAFTPNLSGELAVSQVFGDYSDSILGTLSLVAQPFPEWRLSPFFTVGTGLIYTDPNVTLVDEDSRTDQVGSVGAGMRWYLTRRFILRAEYRRYTVFQDKDDNQEANAWQAGIGFFF
jgi:hypothetical protein